MSSFILRNCYDSHTHFWATGQVAEGLKLQNLKSAFDISQIAIKPDYFRSHWLVGFGWDHHQWTPAELPSRQILDQFFPEHPVFFSRVDGHASWVNSRALQELKARGYDFQTDPSGGRIMRDQSGEPTGILFDQAHINALLLLPEFTEVQHRHFLQSAQQIFNQAGFTHVRDLSMNLFFWNLLQQMQQSKSLTVFLEGFVTIESLADLDRGLVDLQQMRDSASGQLRIMGSKIFIDGSLGSQTAALSQPYQNDNQTGILSWSPESIQEVIRRTWQAGFQVAIHCIGDVAVHTAAQAAREVAAQGVLGRLHLEHVQVMRSETVQLLKPLHVTCHMQPCHWLSDRHWLKSVLPEKLHSSLFQWELLRKNKIPFYFGSDSPIEPTSLRRTELALSESPQWGITQLQGDWTRYHQHPDLQWGKCHTEYADGQVIQVYCSGQALL